MLLGASDLHGFEHVEAHSLAQGPALANCDNVIDLDIPEAGEQVHGHVLGAFLKAVVQLKAAVLCSGGSLSG